MKANHNVIERTITALKDLAKIFLIMLERDRKVEIRKTVLAMMPDFNAWNTFKRLSLNDKMGYLSTPTLYQFLKYNDMETNIDEIERFMTASMLPEIPNRVSYQEFL